MPNDNDDNNKHVLYSANIITKHSAWELLEENYRKQSEHCQARSRSYYFCCDHTRRSAILKWCSTGDFQQHIVTRSGLPVAHFFRRSFYHL